MNVSRSPYVYGYGALTNSGVQYVYEHVAINNVSGVLQDPSPQTRPAGAFGGLHALRVQHSNDDAGLRRQHQWALERRRAVAVRLRVGVDRVGRGRVVIRLHVADLGLAVPLRGDADARHARLQHGAARLPEVLLHEAVHARRARHALRALWEGLESDRLGSLYLGDGSLVRGYSYNSFTANDCSSNGSGSLASSTCPQFDRLVGSRLALANAELRIPLFGTSGFGLIASPLPPIEIAPFVDAGVAWTKNSGPVLNFASNSGDRTPVMRTGIASRINLFGFAVFEVYYAHPLERPGKKRNMGDQLPAWLVRRREGVHEKQEITDQSHPNAYDQQTDCPHGGAPGSDTGRPCMLTVRFPRGSVHSRSGTRERNARRGRDTTYVLKAPSYYLLSSQRSALWNRQVLDDAAWRYHALFGASPPRIAIRLDSAAVAGDSTTTWRGVPFARVAFRPHPDSAPPFESPESGPETFR